MNTQNTTGIDDRNQAYLLAQQGNLAQAKSRLEKYLRRNKNDAQSWHLLARIYAELKQFSDSENAFRKAMRNSNSIPGIHGALATILSLQGKHSEAEKHFSVQASLQPGHPGALPGLVRAAAAQGRLVSTISDYRNYFTLEPGSLEPMIELGNLYWQCGDVKEAQEWYLRALSCNPQSALALNNVGLSYQHQGRMDTAIKYYHDALHAAPGFTDALYNLGTALTYIGDHQGAIDYLKEVITHAPDNEQAIGALANVYHRSGNQEAAYQLVKPVAQAGSKNVNIAVVYAQTSSRLHKNDDALTHLQALVDSKVLHDSAQRLACFTLGKLYDRLGQYEAAFGHYASGNALIQESYDIVAQQERIERLERAFDKRFFQGRATGVTDNAPVFIVGMPRSGTSLVEQILACHSQVTGGGELTHFPDLLGEMFGSGRYTTAYPESVCEAQDDELSDLARRYLEKLHALSPDSPRITDKLPDNFMHLGMIAALFPNARIIHCKRDPIDTCLSCYFQNFGGTHTYSTRLRTLASYYRLYERIMAHWHEVLPVPILDFQYEELVNNQEAMSRRLLAFCGLEWEETCLAFHNHGRITSTASYEQVNRPLYKGSVARWKNYEAWIGDLLEELKSNHSTSV